MQDYEYKELMNVLRQPHRCQNMFAVFRACEQAADLIDQFKDKIIAPKEGAKKTRAKKAD
jgi:hypothetical protein